MYANDHDFVISLAYHNAPAERKVFVVNDLQQSASGVLTGVVVDALVYASELFARDLPRLAAFLNKRLGRFAVCVHPSQR